MTYLHTSGEALARESPAPSPEERLELAQAAYDAARDGSRRHSEASALAMRALAGFSATPPEGLAARAFALGCVALCCCDAYDALDAALDAAIDSALGSGSPRFIAGAWFDRAHSRLRQGRVVEAIDDLDRIVPLARHHGPEGLVRAAGLRALCVLERDGPEAAQDTLALAPLGEDRHLDPRCCLWLLARARAATAAGHLTRAIEDLAEVGERQLLLGAPNPAHLSWRSEASEVALRLGRREQALAFAFEELELARLFGSPRALGIALRSSGAVCGGERGRELLSESVAVLRGSGARLELARALVELGALVRRGGERRDARAALREGCDLADRLGATRLGARARDELAAAGARPRRDWLSGTGALTPSERRIAERAAAGASNREIASALFVTMRTVTTHLTHVYQKLDVSGRRELEQALALGSGVQEPADALDPAASSQPGHRAAGASDPLDGASDPLDGVSDPLDGVSDPDGGVSDPDGGLSDPDGGLFESPGGGSHLLGSASGAYADLAVRSPELTGAALALARSVAVLGRMHAARFAGPLSRLEGHAVERAWRELAAAELLRPRELWFAAAGLEHAVYRAIPPYERSQAHRDAARLLAVQRAGLDEIADHLLRAEPAGDEEAVALLVGAARNALRRGSPQRGVDYLRRAASEPPAEDHLAAIVAELGAAEALAGDAGAYADLGQALSLASDADTRGQTAWKLAGVHYWAGRFADCHAVASRAIAELGSDADPELLSCLESIRIGVELIDGRFAGSLAERMPYLRMLSVAADTGGQALLILEGFWRWQHRLPGESPRALVERGTAFGFAGDLVGVAGPATAFSAVMFVLADETERAWQLLERILASARRTGHVGAEVLALAWHSHLALRTGRAAAAERAARAAVELTDGRDLGAIAPLARCFHAEALAERGSLAEAVQTIESASPRGLDDTAIAAHTLFVRGRVRLLQGRPVEAAADLRACGAASKGLFTDLPEACPWRSTLALALASSHREKALELGREELALARRRRHARAVGAALRACGLVEGGEVGIELLREAVEGLASTDARLEHARALTDLGVALSRADQPDAASEYLREGLEASLLAGATALADRAVRELVATRRIGKRS